MLEFLKTTRYSKVLDDKMLNKDTSNAMEEVEAGQAKTYASVKELMLSLKKLAGV